MNTEKPGRPLTLRVAMNPEAATPDDVRELALWLQRERVFGELINRGKLKFESRARQPDSEDPRTPMGPFEDLLMMLVEPVAAYPATRLLEEAEASVRAWWATRRAQRGEGTEAAPEVIREGDGG